MHQIDYVVWKEADAFVSKCLNVEVASCGDTREEAILNLREAITLYFEDENNPQYAPVELVEVGSTLVDA